MGKFSGILLCSDWDGTLHTSAGVSREDVDAIRYFQANGGLFTICSGRPPRHLGEFFTDFEPNTYVLCLNGAVIADSRSGEIIHRAYLDGSIRSLLEKLFPILEDSEMLAVHYELEGEPARVNVRTMDELDAAVADRPIYKVVLLAVSTDAIARAKQCLGEPEGYTIVCSWETGLEILSAKSAKGSAVKRLKKLTGAHTLITVGDYENDIDMLRTADISYAVYNAPDRVSKHATHHLPPLSSAAPIAAIVKEIDERVCNSAAK